MNGKKKSSYNLYTAGHCGRAGQLRKWRSNPCDKPTCHGRGMKIGRMDRNAVGLAPATTYHFRIVATNVIGTRNGGDKTFTTSP